MFRFTGDVKTCYKVIFFYKVEDAQFHSMIHCQRQDELEKHLGPINKLLKQDPATARKLINDISKDYPEWSQALRIACGL